MVQQLGPLLEVLAGCSHDQASALVQARAHRPRPATTAAAHHHHGPCSGCCSSSSSSTERLRQALEAGDVEAVLAGAAQGGSLVQAGVFEQRRMSQELRALAVLASPPGSQPWQSRAEAGRCADCDVSVDSCFSSP